MVKGKNNQHNNNINDNNIPNINDQNNNNNNRGNIHGHALNNINGNDNMINNINNEHNNNRINELFNPRLNRQAHEIKIIFAHSNHRKHKLYNFPEIVIEDANKLQEENKKCVICLEEFVSKEKVTALPCIHFFHTPCINKWVLKQNSCPICKFELTQENLKKKLKENL